MSQAKTEWKYKKRKSFQSRREESREILKLYPTSIPVVLEKLPNAETPTAQKEKYLIPRDLSVVEFTRLVQRNMFLLPDTSVFFIAGDELVLSSKNMGEVYDEAQDKDGFLYLNYSAYKPFTSFGGGSDGRSL